MHPHIERCTLARTSPEGDNITARPQIQPRASTGQMARKRGRHARARQVSPLLVMLADRFVQVCPGN